jgi:putative endonuclease
MTNYKKGLDSEKQACRFLSSQGYNCLKHRYQCPLGEIDLMMGIQKTLVAVEVKNRTILARALESISSIQKKRILESIEFFRSDQPILHEKYPFTRIDAIFISSSELYHIENAWQEDSYYL